MQIPSSISTHWTPTTPHQPAVDVQAAKRQRVEPPQPGAGAELLSVLMSNESAWPIVGLVRTGALQIEPGPPRLRWGSNVAQRAIAEHSEQVAALLQGMTAHCPQLVLDALSDLVQQTYSSFNPHAYPLRLWESRITELLALWCGGKVTGELRSVQKWIGILGRSWRQTPGKEKTFSIRRGFLKHLHACSCAQGDLELARWAKDKACELELPDTEASTWEDATPAQPMQADHAPCTDPRQSAVARLNPGSQEEAALYLRGLKAAEQLVHLLGCRPFTDRLAPDILRLLGHGVVLLEPQPPVSPGLLVQTRWRVTGPTPPAAIVGFANLLWTTSPAHASKVVELLFAAWQANRDADRTSVREALIHTALGQHRDHPAILQFPSWILVLSEALSGDSTSGQLRIECEQLLLAWLQPWRNDPVDVHLVAAALRHALAYPAQSPQGHDGLVACLEHLHTGARRDLANIRWTEWALLALYQSPAPSARAVLQRCLAATAQPSELAALAEQLESDGWRSPQDLLALSSSHNPDRVSRLLSLLARVPPPQRTEALLLMARHQAMRALVAGQTEAGIGMPWAFPRFAELLLNEACLLTESPLPWSADIDLLLSTCMACLIRCPGLGPQVLQTMALPLADLLAQRSTATVTVGENSQRVCWEILLRYVEGDICLEHQHVLCLLGQLPLATSSGARLWISRKMARQVLQALEQALSQPNTHSGEALNKVMALARQLLGDSSSFDTLRWTALQAYQQLKLQNWDAKWPDNLRLLDDLYRGPLGAQRAPIIRLIERRAAGSPAPAPGPAAAAALLLAEAAALMARGIGVPPDRLHDLAQSCLRLLELKPRELVDVSELVSAVAAVLASPLAPGPARTAWEQLRELLLGRWQEGGYGIAGETLLDVVWPRLEAGALDPVTARRLVPVYAWHPALRPRVIGILQAHPNNGAAMSALAECQDHEEQLAHEDELVVARKALEDAGLFIELREEMGYDAVSFADGVQWNSLSMKGAYVPHEHRELLERIARMTTHVEECVRILWFISARHGDLQAEQEAARNEWPVFRFTYNAQVTLTVTGTPAQQWIGRRLVQDLMREAFSGKPFNLADHTLTIDPHDVDVRLLRERLYDPQARRSVAATLAPKVVAAWKNENWNSNAFYWSVAECLVGCLLGGRQAEALAAWEILVKASAKGVIDHCGSAPKMQGTSVLLARCMILRRELYSSNVLDAFEAVAKELDWRNPDLGADERLQLAMHLPECRASARLPICTSALPLSLELSEYHVNAAVRFDPQQSLLPDLRGPVIQAMLALEHFEVHSVPVSSVMWTRMAYNMPSGLTLPLFKRAQQSSTPTDMEFLCDAHSRSYEGGNWQPAFRNFFLTFAKHEFTPMLAAAFPWIVQVDRQSAWAAMAAAIRHLTTQNPSDTEAARVLLDAVPIKARGADWSALNSTLRHTPAERVAATELPLPQQPPAASMPRWLASPPGLNGGMLAEKALQAVMGLWLTLRGNDEAGADELLELLREAPDGADALAAIEDGRLAVVRVAPDITGSPMRWTIGPRVEAFQSLGRLALLLIGRADPAGIGLLHRLMRSDMSLELRDELLRKVLKLWGTNQPVRASSRAGWANFFALALRQPALPENMVEALGRVRLQILGHWHKGEYAIAAPVVLALLDTRVRKGERDADEALYLRRLYDKAADSAPVRRWVRQRAMWLGIAAKILPPEDERARREILQWRLAQRGCGLRPETMDSCPIPSDQHDVNLVAALAAHYADLTKATKLLLMLPKAHEQYLYWHLVEVALKLPSSPASTPLRTQLIREWRTRVDSWCGPEGAYKELIVRTAVVLNRLLIAEGDLEDSADLVKWTQDKLPGYFVDWDTGDLRQ